MKNSNELQVAQFFGNKWCEGRGQLFGRLESDRDALDEQLIALLGCDSMEEVYSLFGKAKKTLNAGCGVAWSEFLYDWNNPTLEMHCVDISDSVKIARQNTSHLPNVIVIQASILDLPYPDEMFDIVYSSGVVHHTPDARKAVLELGKKVVKGGLLGIYIYNKKPFIRELCDREIRKLTTEMSYSECMKFSHSMSLLGKALSNITQKLVIEEDIDLLGIKAGEYNLQRFVYGHFVKCWFNLDQDIPFADINNVDWYSPHYASHHTKEEVYNWYEEAGFRHLRCIQPPGYEHSGYFISGRKNV